MNNGFDQRYDYEDLFIQENISYYKNSFNYMYTYEKSIVWNWGAFFFPLCWCWYRKMYTWGSVMAVITLLSVFSGLTATVTLFQMLFMGMSGTWLYCGFVLEELDRIKNEDESVRAALCRKRGGVNLLCVLWVILLTTVIVLGVNASDIAAHMRSFISGGSLFGGF